MCQNPDYLKAAESAVIAARGWLPNGSANVGDAELQVENRALAGQMLSVVRGFRIQYDNGLERILKSAKVAIGGKTGNCEEMTAVAFSILFSDGVVPIRFMSFPINKGDHCFVVIGDNQNGAICDPWAGRAYPIGNFAKEMSILYSEKPPDINDLQMIWIQNQPGSQELFNQITANQKVPDSMDVSRDFPGRIPDPRDNNNNEEPQDWGAMDTSE